MPNRMSKASVRVQADASPIGRGTFGTVCVGQLVEGGETVAVKRCNHRECDLNLGLATPFIREVNALFTLRSPHVLHGLCFDARHAWIAMPLKHASLLTAAPMISAAGGTLAMCVQLSNGLAVLHAAGLAHRDIKPANILFDCERHLFCLSDFGSAVPLRPDDVAIFNQPEHAYLHALNKFSTCTQQVATLWFSAPELLCGSTINSHAADVWSLGVSLCDVILGMPATTSTFAAPSAKAVHANQIRMLSPSAPCFAAHGPPADLITDGCLLTTYSRLHEHVRVVDSIIDAAHADLRLLTLAHPYLLKLRWHALQPPCVAIQMIEVSLVSHTSPPCIRDGLLLSLAHNVGLLVARIIMRMLHLDARSRLTSVQAARAFAIAAVVQSTRVAKADGPRAQVLCCMCFREKQTCLQQELQAAGCMCCGVALGPMGEAAPSKLGAQAERGPSVLKSFIDRLGSQQKQRSTQQSSGCCRVDSDSAWPTTVQLRNYEQPSSCDGHEDETRRPVDWEAVHTEVRRGTHLLRLCASATEMDIFEDLVRRALPRAEVEAENVRTYVKACLSITLKLCRGLFRSAGIIARLFPGADWRDVMHIEAAIVDAVGGCVAHPLRCKLPCSYHFDVMYGLNGVPLAMDQFCERLLWELHRDATHEPVDRESAGAISRASVALALGYSKSRKHARTPEDIAADIGSGEGGAACVALAQRLSRVVGKDVTQWFSSVTNGDRVAFLSSVLEKLCALPTVRPAESRPAESRPAESRPAESGPAEVPGRDVAERCEVSLRPVDAVSPVGPHQSLERVLVQHGPHVDAPRALPDATQPADRLV